MLLSLNTVNKMIRLLGVSVLVLYMAVPSSLCRSRVFAGF